MKVPQLRPGMPDHVSHLGEDALPQWDWPRGCRQQQDQLSEPRLVPSEWGHQENRASDFPNSPDDLRKQVSRREGIKVSAGPIMSQSFLLQEISWAMRIVF